MIVDPAIIIIPTSTRMVHRGASSADNASGDGAGVLLGLPHSYYSAILKYVEHFFSSQNQTKHNVTMVPIHPIAERSKVFCCQRRVNMRQG